ncbi:hypothetical protein F4776DRAFT_665956 [Hypoxylon sp. NC0597]|nr:hypothetical protein F4776DRAFT_665956 [Hypoxylon sp. NC0597]
MSPVKWNLPKLWGMSVLLGVVLAIGNWITVTTMYAQGENGGIVQNEQCAPLLDAEARNSPWYSIFQGPMITLDTMINARDNGSIGDNSSLDVGIEGLGTSGDGIAGPGLKRKRNDEEDAEYIRCCSIEAQ